MNPNEVDALPNWALWNCAPGSFSCLTQTGDGSSSHPQNKFFETCLGQGLWTKYTPNILPEFSVRGPSAKACLKKVGLGFFFFTHINFRITRDGQVYPNEVDALPS